MRRIFSSSLGSILLQSGRPAQQESSSASCVNSSLRSVSETVVGSERPPSWKTFWMGEGQPPQYTSSSAEHPLLPQLRKTTVEWRLRHGHGSRLGSYGPTREIPDFEYSDGTPAPVSRRRFTFSHHQDHLLIQMIKAAAVVEDAAERAWLPRVPGTAEQRDWDPEIPLFLDDVDEHGKVPVSHYLQRERGEGGGGPPFTEPSASSSNGRSTTLSYSARMGLVQQSRMDRKFEKAGVSGKHQATNTNQPGGESLEPITMFASYDPAAFISEPIPRINSDRRPIWSRRRWVMSNEFLVPKSAKPKNTIKDQ